MLHSKDRPDRRPDETAKLCSCFLMPVIHRSAAEVPTKFVTGGAWPGRPELKYPWTTEEHTIKGDDMRDLLWRF